MFDIPTVTSIKKIAFIFFALLGITHFVSGAMASDGILLPFSDLTVRISLIPFGIASLAYIYGILKEYQLEQGNIGKVIDYMFLSLIIIFTSVFLFLEFYFPDKSILA